MATETGVKLHQGKIQVGLIISDFARAISAVCQVGQVGIDKYCPSGWINVPDGVNLYTDAMMRHYLKECLGQEFDDEDGLLEAAHTAWNALARLDLIIRSHENPDLQDGNKLHP